MRSTISSVLSLLLLAVIVPGGQSSAAAQQAVLEAEGTTPGMKVEIRDLKRDEGGTVTLRFRLINDSDKQIGACDMRESGGESCGPISGVHLLDAANKKKYLVVRDSAKKCVCSTIGTIRKGEKANVWAKFPAPPDNVQRVTVVVPHFEPIESVPIAAR